MRRRLGPRGVGDAVSSFVGTVQPATGLARVQGAWPGAVGAVVASHATPVSLRDGVLTVACDSAVWAQEVELLGGELLTRLGSSMGPGTVTSLRVQATHSGRPGRGPAGSR
jgi:predicted nucleic acid-binding Zn ribbon protein